MTAEEIEAALEQLSRFFNFGVDFKLQATVYPRDSLWVVIPTNQLRPSETRGRSADLCLCPRQPSACWISVAFCPPTFCLLYWSGNRDGSIRQSS